MNHVLQVEQWRVERLIPFARNARTHSDEQVMQIAASIAEFGWTNPILAESDCVIIAGHARLLELIGFSDDELAQILSDTGEPAQGSTDEDGGS